MGNQPGKETGEADTVMETVEDLLTLIFNGMLSEENLRRDKHHILVNATNGPGYLTPLMNAIHSAAVWKNKDEEKFERYLLQIQVLLNHGADPKHRVDTIYAAGR